MSASTPEPREAIDVDAALARMRSGRRLPEEPSKWSFNDGRASAKKLRQSDKQRKAINRKAGRICHQCHTWFPADGNRRNCETCRPRGGGAA